jgi:hypothetical protein
MAITVVCPGCGSQLRVRDEYLGRAMKCPKCAGRVETGPVDAVPTDDEQAAVAPGKARPKPPPVPQDIEEVRPAPARRRREHEGDDERRPPGRYGGYAPCPRCGGTHAERVTWTIWGSFYGPAMLNHVQCAGCGYRYNGRSGRSNALAAAVFVMVPLALILGIFALLAWWLWFNARPRRVEAPPAAPGHALVALVHPQSVRSEAAWRLDWRDL